MKKNALFAVGLLAFMAYFLAAAGVRPALGTNDGVCDNLDTGHLSAGNATSTTITAPAGMVIVKVCVKAGSANQGLGPEYQTFDPGVTSVTISHSSGKEISHYSVDYEPAGETTETETTTTTETETEPPTTTTETQPPRLCPDGNPPTPGEGAFDPNDDCARPPVETEPPVTTTTEPPLTTTTTETTTPEPPVTTTVSENPPTIVAPKPKPPKKSTPKPPKKTQKSPPVCPVATPHVGRCAVQGSG